MANNIELITTYSPKYWDLVYKQEAVTSILDANPKMVQFTGTKTVKIGKWQNGGLQNYYRNNDGDGRVGAAAGTEDFAGAAGFGYQKSSARLVWEEFTLKMDRAAAFEIEYFDNEESGEELVGLGVTEISRTAIVPEVDAYCLSTIAGLAGKVNKNITSGSTSLEKPIAALNDAFVYMQEHEVPIEDQVVFASPEFVNALRNTNEVTKFLGQSDFAQGKDIKFEITRYQGRDIITVSPDRLRTDFKAVAAGSNGGYYWGSESEAINFLMVAKSAVMHVVKYNKVKIISGEANLAGRGFDGYTIFARIYHDVFVPDNKRVAIYCDKRATAKAAPTLELTVGIKDSKVNSITTVPGDKLCFVVSAATGTEVGSQLSEFKQVKVGDAAISGGSSYYAIDSDAKVLAVAK